MGYPIQVTHITISNLTLRNGYSQSSDGGGAIDSYANVTIISSDFYNDSVKSGGDGGAIYTHSNGQNLTVTGSNFTWCHGSVGGALNGGLNAYIIVNTSSFVNCYANGPFSSGSGGAIYGREGGSVNFCRFSNVTSDDSSIIDPYGTSIDLSDNWWGTNSPTSSLSGGESIPTFLKLGVTSTPVTMINQTSSIQANLSYYSDGTTQSGNIPTNGMPVVFTVSPSASGTMNPSSGIFTTMQSPASTFTPTVGGPVTVNVIVDAETIPINFDVVPILTGIIPATSVNTSAIPVTINGAGFYNTTTTLPTVNLTQNGYNNVTLTNVNVSSVTSINGTIPLGIPAGVWNVVITNPDGLESSNVSVTFTATQYVPTPTMTPTPIVTQHHGNPYNGGGQTGGNTQNGYTGPQPASQGGVPAKPVVVQQEAPPENTPIASITALAPVQNPSILAMVILTLQEYQFWLILAVIIIILVAILRRWWIKRQNPLLFKK